MGFTYYAPMKSEKALTNMEDFIRRHFRQPKIVFGKDYSGKISSDAIRKRFPLRGDRTLDLGFDIVYILHQLEYVYLIAVTQWMAAKSGQTRVLKGSTESLKYIRDYEENLIPLENQSRGIVMRKPDKWPRSWITGFSKKNLDKIEKEIDCLEDAWFIEKNR